MKFLTLGKIVSLTATAVTAVTWFKPWTLNIESLQSKSKSMVKVSPYSLICIPGILCNLRSCTSETSDVSGSSFATLGFLLLSSGNMHNSKLKAAGKSLRHAAYGPRSIFGIESRVNCFWRVYYRSSGLGRVYNIFSNYVNQSTNLPKYVIMLCIMIAMFLYVSLTFLAFLDCQNLDTDVTQRDLKDSEFWRHCQTVTENIFSSLASPRKQLSVTVSAIIVWAIISAISLLGSMIPIQIPTIHTECHSATQRS